LKQTSANRTSIEVPEGILDGIYEAASEEAGWARVLREIAEWVSASGAMYFLLGNSAITPSVKAIHSSGFNIGADSSYANEEHLRDPHMSLGMQTPIAHWFFSQDHFDHRFIARDAFFQEVMSPLGIRWAAGSRIWNADETVACLAFQRPLDAPGFTEIDRMRLAAVTPHLGRATRIHDKLTGRAFEAGLGIEAMSNLAVGVALMDACARIVYSNPVADRLFGQNWIFRCLPRGRISLAYTNHQKIFEGAIAAAVGARSTALCIVDRNGKPAVSSVMMPMPPAARWNSHWQRPLAMLVMSEIRRVQGVPARILHQLFALTPAESRLANWLLTGRSISEYANERRISVETVRTQLKAILSKTGMRRQAELVALLSRLPAFGSGPWQGWASRS
jgi:DNA-binding CsgD family transcriptional regulator